MTDNEKPIMQIMFLLSWFLAIWWGREDAFVTAILLGIGGIFIIRRFLGRSVVAEEDGVCANDPANNLYLQLYVNSPVPYFIINTEGLVRSANLAASRMLGLPQHKLVGINIFEQLHSEQADHLNMLVRKYQSGVAVSDELVRVKRADHREIWALLALFGVAETGGQMGLLAMVDITKQKKAEDAKSEFVSLASHQLRTPIAGMKWSTELLLMDGSDKLSSNQKKYIERLLESIGRMARLVDDFLRVSRFELGTFRPEYRTVELIPLFNDVMLEMGHPVAQKNLTVRTFFDESLPTIVTDSNLLRMILTNLYSNAVKYTPDKGTIHIGYARREGQLLVSVADNGMGIPIEDQEEIFSKLFRASNAIREVPDGTGLGLYIVREAVAVLGGSVSFKSTEKVGTTFEIKLPLTATSGDGE